MILQALVGYYDQLAKQGKLERPGWLDVKVSYALRLNQEGQLMAVMDVREETKKGNKTAMLPKAMPLPAPVKRASGISANFLCDNVTYMLGIDSKGKPERAVQCFQACAALHRKLLHDVEAPAAKAILAFFEHWEPEKAAEHPLIAPMLKELAAANLVFRLDNTYAHEVPVIQQAWQNHYDAAPEDSARQRCLVTGEMAEIAQLHPTIKGVREAQAMGASLVSFNARAFESYGHDEEQGRNAPVSKQAAFAYGAALNHLLADRDHTLFFGDTTMVFWAETAETVYADAFAAFMGANEVRDDALQYALERLSEGLEATWERFPMQPDNRFFILGLAPNAARLSVRFFLQSSFGDLARHLIAHQKRLEIQRPSYVKYESLSIQGMLRETVNPNASNKNASPQMTGDVLRAIMTDTPYPATLYQQTQLRIRAEHVISWGKASIIKAYLLKNLSQGGMKKIISEVAQVKLNDQTTYLPYILGRLFAVLEDVQKKALPEISVTIRDRYFNSACCTPAMVFPTLIRLSQAHLKTLRNKDEKLYYFLSRIMQRLMGMIDQPYPARLNLTDQGIFQLGYYHQIQNIYTSKEDKDHE